MLEQDGGQSSLIRRPRIVDVARVPQPAKHAPKQRRGRNNSKDEHPSNASYPLEMQDIIRASREYARRTHALGALRGALAISELTATIRSLGPQTADMIAILEKADNDARTLRSMLNKVYEDG